MKQGADHAQQAPQAIRPLVQLTGAPEGQVSTQPSPLHEHAASPRQVTAQVPVHSAAQLEKSSQVRLLSAERPTTHRAAPRQVMLLDSPAVKLQAVRPAQVTLEREPTEPWQFSTVQVTAARSPP